MSQPQYQVVGTRQPLVDSWKKVAGAAVYGDDVRFPTRRRGRPG